MELDGRRGEGGGGLQERQLEKVHEQNVINLF